MGLFVALIVAPTIPLATDGAPNQKIKTNLEEKEKHQQ